MLGVDAGADVDGVLDATVDRAVFEAVDAFDDAGRTDADVLEQPGVDDAGAFAHPSHGRTDRGDVTADHLAKPLNHLGPVPIERHHIGGVGRQVVIDRDFPPAGFIDYGHLRAVAE